MRFTPADWNEAQTVTVSAAQDADAIADDPVTLAHTVKGGDYEGLAAPVVTVTIAEDDVPGVKVSETALAVAEGDAGTYTVALDTEPAAEVTVAVAVPEGADLTVTPSELRFTAADWNTEQTVTVTAIQDADAIADDPVTLAHEVSGGDYEGLAAASVEVTITEDDVPGVTIADAEAPESAGQLLFTVTLSPASSRTVTVDCRTADGTARAHEDYTAAANLLTFAPGRTEAQIAVPVANDGLREGNETFTVVLSNPANATVADGAATGTIVDDDASVDEAWLARFGRTAAGQVIEALDERLTRPQRGAHLTIGGQRLQLGEAPEPGSRPPHRNIHPDYRAAAGGPDPVGPSFLSSDLPGPLRAPGPQADRCEPGGTRPGFPRSISWPGAPSSCPPGRRPGKRVPGGPSGAGGRSRISGARRPVCLSTAAPGPACLASTASRAARWPASPCPIPSGTADTTCTRPRRPSREARRKAG